jgi:hypothetical protein
MNSPFTLSNLILRSYSIEGTSNLIRETDQQWVLQSAQDVVDEYSCWDEDQGFGSSDMTFAIQRFLDTLIRYSGLNYRTEFTPRLTVVQNS